MGEFGITEPETTWGSGLAEVLGPCFVMFDFFCIFFFIFYSLYSPMRRRRRESAACCGRRSLLDQAESF